jgi:hypothetical protein
MLPPESESQRTVEARRSWHFRIGNRGSEVWQALPADLSRHLVMGDMATGNPR